MKKFILLLSFLCAFGVWAQDQETEEAEQENQNAEQVLDTDLTPEELAAAENDELVLGDEAEEQEENTNSRFIPTEEISQDLGVSFPVDI